VRPWWQQLSLWSIFDDAPEGAYHYWRGFNWLALGSVVLGQAVYLWLYNPMTGETHDLFRFMPASIAACLVPALVYWIGMRLLAMRAGSCVAVPAAVGLEERGRLSRPNI
jgi:NCS1 family nucleobase:cation symporter-1